MAGVEGHDEKPDGEDDAPQQHSDQCEQDGPVHGRGLPSVGEFVEEIERPGDTPVPGEAERVTVLVVRHFVSDDPGDRLGVVSEGLEQPSVHDDVMDPRVGVGFAIVVHQESRTSVQPHPGRGPGDDRFEELRLSSTGAARSRDTQAARLHHPAIEDVDGGDGKAGDDLPEGRTQREEGVLRPHQGVRQ